MTNATQNNGATPARTSLFTKIVAVITALSLVFLQVPVTSHSSQAMADATNAAEMQAAANMSVDVPLTFENAFIVYEGQVIAPPATKVTIPGGAAMEFAAEADSGYQLESVRAVIDGTEVELAADENGVYKLTAADVINTTEVVVRAITAPTVEEAVVTTAPEEPAAEQPASEEPAADTAAPAVNTQAEFVYEDASVKVVATLTDPAAIPANAEFRVAPITERSEGYSYDALMGALNKSDDSFAYDSSNTLLYDVAFMIPKTDDAGNVIDGEFVEFEPEKGTVSIEIKFKANQLSDGILANDAADIEIKHLALTEQARDSADSTAKATNLDESDIIVEAVKSADASVEAGQVSFAVDSLSPISITNKSEVTDPAIVFEFVDRNGNPVTPIVDGTYYPCVRLVQNGRAYYWMFPPELDFSDMPLGQVSLKDVEFRPIYSTDTTQYNGGELSVMLTDRPYSEDWMYDGAYGNNTPYGYKSFKDGDEFSEYYTLSIGGNNNGVVTISAVQTKEPPVGGLQAASVDGEATTSDMMTDYSLYNILNSYCLFVQGDVNSNHMVGPVAVGGNANIGTIGTNDSVKHYRQSVYIKGEAHTGNIMNSVKPLYLGTVNKGHNGAEPPYSGWFGYDAFNPGRLPVYYTNDYIDFDEAFDSIESQVDALVSGTTWENGYDYLRDGTLSLPAGGCYEFDTFPSGVDFQITGATHAGNDTIILINQKGTVGFPEVSTGLSSSAEVDAGSSLTYLLPNASTVKPSSSWVGHIVAPKANIDMGGSQYAGCFVAKKVTSAGEGHLWPYNGHIFTPTSTNLKVNKEFLNENNEPVDFNGRTFTAQLESIDGAPMPSGTQNGKKTVTMTSADPVYFGNITFDYQDKAGTDTYQYTLREVNEGLDNVVYDEAVYHLRAVVSYYEDTSYNGSTTVNWYYKKGDDGEETGLPNDGITFKNTENSPAEETVDVSIVKEWDEPSGASTTRPASLAVSLSNGKATVRTVTLDAGNNWSATVTGLPKYDGEREITYTWAEPSLPAGYELTDTSVNGLVTTLTNTYFNDTSIAFAGDKAMTGRDLTEGEFRFSVTEVIESNGAWVTKQGGFSQTVTNQAPGEGNKGVIPYPTISYSLADEGMHYYIVKEVLSQEAAEASNHTVDGLTYDANYYTVGIEVAKDAANHTMTATVKSVKKNDEDYTSAEGPAYQNLDFANSYTATETTATFSGNKTIGIREFADQDSFTFKVSPDRADYPMPAQSEVTVSGAAANGSNLAYAFGEITYTQAGTYTYTVSEVAPSAANEGNAYTAAGVTYDRTVYSVTVTVADNMQGQLTATTTVKKNGSDYAAGADHLDFANTYAAEGAISFAGFKTMEGRALKAGEFTFSVTENGKPVGYDPADSASVPTNTMDAEDGQQSPISYPTIRYYLNGDKDDTGKHIYIVTEASGSGKEGVAANTTRYEVTVNVTDNFDGTLSAAVTQVKKDGEIIDADATYDFVNTYEAAGDVTFEGTKSIDTRALKAGETYQFNIVETTPGVADPYSATVSNSGSAIQYPTIRYTQADAGTHTYKVTESAVDADGVKGDATEYEVTVNVSDNGDGTLKVVSSDNYKALNFENKYEAAGSITFEGAKSIDGRDLGEDDVFEFVISGRNIEGGSKTVLSAPTTGVIDYPQISFSMADLANGDGTYATEKQFTYTIAEQWVDGTSGITKSTSTRTVDVTVRDNVDGTLSVTAPNNGKGVDFVNAYNATGKITFEGAKSITGRDMTSADVFTFQVRETTPDSGKVWNVSNAAPGGAIAYPEITYTLADVGTHVYKVKETTTRSDMTTDPNEYEVTVAVSDNGDGTLKVEPSANWNQLDFTNAYTTKGSFQVGAEKTVNGGDPGDKKFTFKLKGYKLPGEGIEVQNDGRAIAFPAIEFTTEDIANSPYTYEITEIAEGANGVTYSGDTKHAIVTVSRNATGAIQVSQTFAEGETAVFDNGYIATGDITFEGTKSIDGRALTADDTFTFEVSENGTDKTWTAANDATGKIAYPTISYTLADVGDHTYTVREVSTDGKGVTVATNIHTVTVNVSDNGDGTLKVEPSSNYKSLNFENTYAASGDITFAGTKFIEGRDRQASDIYQFEILERGKIVPVVVSNDATGKIAYPTISYTLADVGDHTYTVREVSTDGKGVTVDTNSYEVTVSVSDNGDGTLSVTADHNNGTGLDFVNTYEAAGDVTFEGAKSIDTRALKAGETYQFNIVETTPGVADPYSATVSNSGSAIQYPTIRYTQADAGTHTYKVTESAVDADGVKGDATEYEVTVNVSDNGDGTLKVVSSDNYKALNFENKYEAAGSITFEGAKSIDGRDLGENDVFTFEVSENGTENKWTAANDATGKIAYPTISYTLADAGEHTYQVRETSEDGAGVTVDANSYEVTVSVSDNGDGTLKVEKSDNWNALNFENTYQAAGDVTFEGTKSLAGRALTADDTFTFEVSENGTDKTWTAANDATGKIAYPTISYTLADLGDHTYTVREASTDGNGVTVDTNAHTVTVKVTDNGDGTLKVEKSDNWNALNFTNTYAATGNITFEGVKTLEGRDLTDNDVFTFEVSENGTDKTWTAANDATGTIAYPTISYTLDDLGDHTYTVRETSTDGAGVTVDANSYEVNVNVSDNGDGTLKVEPSSNYKSLNFVNQYTADGTIALHAAKTLNNNAPGDKKFKFMLQGPKVKGENNTETVENVGGSVTFSALQFTTADVRSEPYEYTIIEVVEGVGGTTYDTTVHHATITVSREADGTLVLTPKYDGNSDTPPVFANTYQATGSVAFAGTKSLTGRALTADDTFTFEVSENGTENKWTAANDATGKIAYPTISYTLDDLGEHTYQVRETSEDGKGVTVDANSYEVNVNVSDNGDGTLKVEPSGNFEALNFENTYQATGDVTFEGTKSIDGRSLTAADVFTFEVSENGTENKWTAENNVNGTIAYPTISYTLADVGEHTYTVKETSTDGAGVTVDTNSYEVTVNVSDNGDGTLNVEPSGNWNALNFANTYTATGDVTFEGTKSIDGRALTADDVFTFEVSENGTDKTWTAANDATGTIAYPTITYTLADVGEHTYQVRETSESGNGVTVDASTHTVTVSVSDNGDGTLNVEPSGNYNALNFENTYAATGNVTFEGVKILEGRDLTDRDAYEFKVFEGETAVATAYSKEDGKIAYPTISYTLDDLGEHTYTVRETSTDGAGVTVATNTHTVTVKVTDNGDGTLKVEPSDNNKALSFENAYQATGDVTFEGVKSLTGRALTADDTFTFEVSENGTENKWTAENNVNGTIAYPTISYTLADVGEHTYTVKETSTDGAGVTVDANSYEVTVNVSDKGDGTLKVEPSGNYKSLNFANTYQATGALDLSGTKTLTGRKAVEGEFHFAVMEGSEIVAEASNAENGDIIFPSITYTLDDVGDHTYTVQETTAGGAGVTRDERTFTVEVSVSDNGDGTLNVAPKGDMPEIAFVNSYTKSNSIQLHASKTLNDGTPGAKTFEFTLSGPKVAGGVETVTNNGADVTFGAIAFETADARTDPYVYTITEVAKNESGYEYDTASYTVNVVVTATDEGELVITPYYPQGKVPTFKNAYSATGDVTFAGTKSIDGRALTADDVFTFEISENGTDKTWTAANDATGKIAYPTISYTLDDLGEHTYTVRETSTDGAGVTVDANSYEVNVNVSDNGDGTLKVEPSGNWNALNFANTYQATGDVTFEGAKSLAGRALTADDAFTFEVSENGTENKWTAKNNVNGTIAYPTISYTLADVGEHTYTVKETSTDGAGVAVDANSYEVTVNVSDNGDGTLNVEPSGNWNALNFANTYTATGDVTFEGTKSIDGRALTADDTFTFEISENGTDKTWTAANDATGTIAYPTITYTLADVGEHTYQVRETSESGNGVTVDASTHTVTVNVSDNGDGTLNVEPSGNYNALNFENKYTADGSVTFQGEKTMENRDLSASDAFTFTITQVDAQGNVIKVLSDKASATGASGAIEYPTISYALNDLLNDDGSYATSKTFYYTVTEDVPTDATITDEAGNTVTYGEATDAQKRAGGFTKDGVTYSSDVKAFTVEVTDDGMGTLNAVATVDSGELMSAAASENEPSRSSTGLYKTATNLDGNYNSTVRVKLTGEAAPEPEPPIEKPKYDIVFVVDASQSQGMSATDLMNQMFAEAENGGYDVNIGIVKYYYVAQVTRYLDGSRGWDESSKKAGTNLPAGILLGTKLLDDDTSVPDENKYLVVLSDGDTYIYQRGNALNSYMKGNVLRTYGDDAMVVTQTHSGYNGGKPFAGPGSYSWKYHNGNAEPADFAAPADWDAYFATVGPQVAADAGAYETKWDWHTNNLYNDATNAIPADEIFDHANSADTSLYYSLVNYRAASAKYHTYAAFVFGGYDRPYGASFMAYLNGGATLDLSNLGDTLATDIASSAAASVAKGGVINDVIGYGYDNMGNAYDMDFVNSIETTDIIFNGKTLAKAVTDDGAFTFGTAKDGGPLFTLTYTGKAEPGTEGYKVEFSDEVLATDTVEMRYNVHLADPQAAAGTYGNFAGTGEPEGTIGLLVSSGATFTRDNNTQVFANPVVSYSALGFDNSYSAEGSVTLEGTKSMEGRTLTDGDVFTFEVTENGATVATGTNDATGKIAFTPISYTLDDAGTHTYIVKETSEGANGVVADSREYTVTVEVSDNGDGTLAIDVSDSANELAFVNTYNASGKAEVKVQKTLVGREWTTDDAFEFTITPVGDAPAFATNTATVTVGSEDYTESFGEVSLEKAGTYQWTVSEAHKGETIDNVTYDSTDKTVTVVVRDDGAGNLVADESSALVQTAAFTNTYEEPYDASTDVSFIATKSLEGRTLYGEEFTFTLSEGENVIGQAVNNGAGEVRFDTIHYTLADVGEHTYTVREVKGDLAGVAYDEKEHSFKVKVSDNGDRTLGIEVDGVAQTADKNVYTVDTGAAFANTYVPSGSVVLEATKQLNGATLEPGAYTFEVATGMGDSRKVITSATNDANGNVKFPALTFSTAGTYKYTISEVVPANAQKLGSLLVADGVAYDTHAVDVTIVATDDFYGHLNCVVSYDGTAVEEGGTASFQNDKVPGVEYPLSATKDITGRAFAAGDTFTFTVEAAGDGAPMPERTSATITPAAGKTQAAIDFGNITFTTDDLGKTYTYTVSEQRAGETVDGLTFDPFSHWVKLTVNGNGDGTLRVDAQYEKAGGIVFTNEYAAEGQAVIEAQKTLSGRALADREFYFELTGDGLDEPMHAPAAADGSVVFAPIGYTQADLIGENGEVLPYKDFHYTISETAGTLGGVTYDTATHGVTVRLSDGGSGTLNTVVTYDEGAVPTFANTYTAEGTEAELEVQKMLVGGELTEGQFEFTLTGVSENVAGVSQTVKNDADGKVAFDRLAYDAPGTYVYRVAEVVPADAVDNGDGTATAADGIVYDMRERTVTVTVADNGHGKLEASVDYGEGAAGVSFGNRVLTAKAGLEFDKYFFGGVGTFDFTLTAVDAAGMPRAGAAAAYGAGDAIVDDGTSAFTVTVKNGAYEGGVAKVTFPEITYAADGDYYYLVAEAPSTTPGMVADEASYLVHVAVAAGEATTTVELIYGGVNLGATDDLSFYNNSAVGLGFASMSAQSSGDFGRRVSVYPEAKKYLNGKTDQLVGGEFAFELLDGATGEVIAAATNDEAGNVAFFDEETDPGLAYDEPGDYFYYMREVAGDEAGVEYDSSVILVTVSVTEDANGALAAEVTYNGPGGAEPAFYNVKEGMDIEVYKVSRFGGEGLDNCTYALWMAGEAGDVMLQEATSDETGRIIFRDVTLIAGQKYFFKEVEAPAGHTVDPYRTAYFSLNETGDALVLVEDTASDGWHSATENIEIDQAKGEAM